DPVAAQAKPRKHAKYRGYTVMAGGLGRSPSGPTDMWSNTAKRHLEFIDKARINLVVVEIPYGVNKRHPKSSTAAGFIKSVQKRKVEVWIIYPHVLAQTFDLPRQVGADGKEVAWNCCFNNPKVQDWMVANGRSVVEAYRPDGLILFGTFHKGGKCGCAFCKSNRAARTGKSMEDFFVRWSKEVRSVQPKTRLGTCSFWGKTTRKTMASVDVVCPVVPIFRPGYADAGQVKGKAALWKSSYKGKLVVPYVKLFLARQTDSKTADILAAAREGVRYCDGFFYWGYNPGHGYAKQDYDHAQVLEALAELAAGKRRSRKRW
ncbi:MAG: hypothetical protein ACYTGW_15610, partial [Planctomycetota bacterium]